MPFIVGLTGGIGSGKTTVANSFKIMGANVIDADEISHQLTAQGEIGFTQILKNFGTEYLDPSGNLNRKKLGEKIFNDPVAKKKLESLLHPLINLEIKKIIEHSTAPYILLVIPLLLETGNYRGLVNRILVVDCDPQYQIKRVMKRSNLNSTQVRTIMATQMPRAERLKQADDIILNDADLNSLKKQAETLHTLYMQQAQLKSHSENSVEGL